MKKGIIATLAVTICVMFTVAYAFAAPGKTEKKEVKKEATTTTEKQKETTTAAKPKTETKESEVPNIEETETKTEEESDIEDTEEVSDDQEESDDSEPEEDLDNEEIDDEEIDHCNHEWSEKSVAYDPEEGYVWVQDCEKCSLVKQTPATEEDYDAAQQEELEEN